MSVMDEYIKIVQDAITKYLKLVFERKFNKQICDSYIKTYIDVRYYNVNERGNHRTLSPINEFYSYNRSVIVYWICIVLSWIFFIESNSCT